MFFVGLGFTDFCIDAIKPHHLYTYSALILICYIFLDKSYLFTNKDIMCLSFLIVFINSEYWEFSYRFFKIVSWGIDKNDIQQLAHLLPFFGLKYTFNYRRKHFKIIIYGCLFTIITSMIKVLTLQNAHIYYQVFYMIVQRIVTLYCLTMFYITVKQNDNVILKRKRRGWFTYD